MKEGGYPTLGKAGTHRRGTEMVVSPVLLSAVYAFQRARGPPNGGPGSALSDGHLHWHPQGRCCIGVGGLTSLREREIPSQFGPSPILPTPVSSLGPCQFHWAFLPTHPPSISIKPSTPAQPIPEPESLASLVLSFRPSLSNTIHHHSLYPNDHNELVYPNSSFRRGPSHPTTTPSVIISTCPQRRV